jgi:ATP-dependent DNA helicase RecG
LVKAKERLAFEELFFIQLTATHRKSLWKKERKGNIFHIASFAKDIQKLKESLPFTLTTAQEKAVADIFLDMQRSQPMNRLLEGDVGSGKTVVAALAMYMSYLNGYQSILMAPTEILAIQHHKTISKILEPFGLEIAIRTGSKKSEIKEKQPHIIIGTHAVLSHKVHLDTVGLVVIDEQQRFGVEQRSILRKKGVHPHVLSMTATPIPRTVALTLYGDLDLSFLDEMPKGRQIIKTWVVPEKKRDAGYRWIEKQLMETKSQAFIICPFIEESENMTTIKAATKEYERLKKQVFPKRKLGLLHGRMKEKEKHAVLVDFKNKKYDILVATPVVEVGIDIPNATIIVIEAAERFGLAQLHQLRGRVGRGDKQSYCLLFTDNPQATTKERLKALETMHNGAKLAEVDYKLRGPGEMYGISQHGRVKLKIASFGDSELMITTKKEAENLYPHLAKYPLLSSYILSLEQKQISPD